MGTASYRRRYLDSSNRPVKVEVEHQRRARVIAKSLRDLPVQGILRSFHRNTLERYLLRYDRV